MSESTGYDKTKDVVLGKYFSKTETRYLNVTAYSYNGGAKKIRIVPASKNTNPAADKNKLWIQGKGISGITKPEAQALIVALTAAIKHLD